MVTLHYITLYYIRTIYSGLSKYNCKEFSVFGEMFRAMGQTGHYEVDCSRVVGRSIMVHIT